MVAPRARHARTRYGTRPANLSEGPVHPWLAELHRALRVEESAQRTAHEDALRLAPADQIAAGVRWPALHCEDQTRRRGERSVRLRLIGRGSLHDGIGPGDRVHVNHRGRDCSGRIEDAGETRALVRLEREDPLGEILDGPISISLAFDPSTLVRMRQAIERADEAGSTLRSILLPEARQDDRPEPSPVPAPELNEAQQAALGIALAADPIALVHGPPGTGKTRLLAQPARNAGGTSDRPGRWQTAMPRRITSHWQRQPWVCGCSGSARPHGCPNLQGRSAWRPASQEGRLPMPCGPWTATSTGDWQAENGWGRCSVNAAGCGSRPDDTRSRLPRSWRARWARSRGSVQNCPRPTWPWSTKPPRRWNLESGRPFPTYSGWSSWAIRSSSVQSSSARLAPRTTHAREASRTGRRPDADAEIQRRMSTALQALSAAMGTEMACP